ncbi:1552_t:CDS:2, partial [Dentiscutata erythropus]
VYGKNTNYLAMIPRLRDDRIKLFDDLGQQFDLLNMEMQVCQCQSLYETYIMIAT